MEKRAIPVNYPAVIVTGLMAFVLSLLWYSPLVFGKVWMQYRDAALPSPPGWVMIFAPLRELIVAWILAMMISRFSLYNWKGAVQLCFLLWLAFHAVGMAGAVIWDHMPLPLALVHAGDWLMKMLFMALLLSTWHRKKSLQQNGVGQ